MSDLQPTERFTSRVEAYVRYRPNYPAALLPLLIEQTGLASDWEIADIGSGPGNLTRLFLDNGYSVVGVEPNDAMRAAGDSIMGGYPRFRSCKGTAEATGLGSDSIDLITAAQAFHWFEPAAARVEFERILRGDGWVALIWNRRPEGAAPVLDAWNEMLQELSPEYCQVAVRDDSAEANMRELFGGDRYQRFTLPHEQTLTADAFWGRLISSSYTPQAGEPGHDELKARSQAVFDRYAANGLVRFPYETQIYIGMLP